MGALLFLIQTLSKAKQTKDQTWKAGWRSRWGVPHVSAPMWVWVEKKTGV
jgi:hypothetical protein